MSILESESELAIYCVLMAAEVLGGGNCLLQNLMLSKHKEPNRSWQCFNIVY